MNLTSFPDGAPLLQLMGLTTHYRMEGSRRGGRGAVVQAAQDVSFTVARGEIVGLIGESGSGKSTVGRTLARLETATAGTVLFDGEDILALRPRRLGPYRRRVQVIFQDPASSLNPRMRVGDIVAEPLKVHGLGSPADRQARVIALLADVGLGPDALGRYPRSFSGGQRQRIGIARALAAEPDLIIADEPVSALDVSVQAQVINLLADLRQTRGLALLFISHDLSTVAYLCDKVVVMYRGRVMEIAPAGDFKLAPLHPYSRQLAADAPKFGAALRVRPRDRDGDLARADDRPGGCVFHDRCPHAIAACGLRVPDLMAVSETRAVACIRPELFS